MNSGRDDEGAVEPYAFESVGLDAGGAVIRGTERRARRVEPRVEVVRVGGAVREIVVFCSCGSCTRLDVEYEREG
jgi:hypothetical protein